MWREKKKTWRLSRPQADRRLGDVTVIWLLWKSFQSVLASLKMMRAAGWGWVCGFLTFLSFPWQEDHCRLKRKRRMRASGLSVDIGQVLVVPVEVATGVEPALGAGVWVGAHLEPPERHAGERFVEVILLLHRQDNTFSLFIGTPVHCCLTFTLSSFVKQCCMFVIFCDYYLMLIKFCHFSSFYVTLSKQARHFKALEIPALNGKFRMLLPSLFKFNYKYSIMTRRGQNLLLCWRASCSSHRVSLMHLLFHSFQHVDQTTELVCMHVSHLVDHSSSFLALSFLAALCFSSSLSFSLLASSAQQRHKRIVPFNSGIMEKRLVLEYIQCDTVVFFNHSLRSTRWHEAAADIQQVAALSNCLFFESKTSYFAMSSSAEMWHHGKVWGFFFFVSYWENKCKCQL